MSILIISYSLKSIVVVSKLFLSSLIQENAIFNINNTLIILMKFIGIRSNKFYG